ncbi:lipid A export ATP-binding/permease protein msbA [Fictibacillus macauensis ZFHKF-1]|uniref:Lipid A export ATP-binding/permease protein msbA n=1 Tax=Fictibacillus macauensis ZFHKF-1 TaxID=1196324 RepID=I8UBF2_9BACL|nr:lipid A export ATP-binding/permease protein msbA [Fictibacillus macauensis ZFHKF-1]
MAMNHVIDDLLPTNNWRWITFACIALLAVFLIGTVMNYVVAYFGHCLGVNIETDMRRDLFARLQRHSFSFFDNHKTGHLVSRLTNDLMDIGEVAHHGPEDLFIAFMTIIGSFSIMFSINWKLALILAVAVPIIIVVSLYYSKKMSNAFHNMYGKIAGYNARIENNIGGIRIVQSFTKEDHEIALFQDTNAKFRSAKLGAYKIMARSSSINFALMKVILLLVLGCGSWFVIQKEMSYGEFVAFVMLSTVFIAPVKHINQILELLPKGYAGFKRYLEMMDLEPDIQDAKDAIEMPRMRGAVTFSDVHFQYEASQEVLQQLSFSVKPGETLALVGPSGGGKTTICSLIPRFYDVTSGSITIDDIDLRDMTLASLRSQIGVVQQDLYLFDGSIADNIRYGNFEATEEQVWDAVRNAQLEELVASLPEGLQTMIGERGVKLSGGQKQRISIARMFLKDPAILILDEATSALDTKTERAIQVALDQLTKDRTTFIIAHRLSTIRNADKIIVVRDGHIEEEGSHERLMNEEGHYYQLLQTQTV